MFFGLLAMAMTINLNAQSKPAASPLGKVYQRVGVTDVEVTYSRPGMKGRDIFATGGLVPFGKLWRTGANAATTISFSTDVMIGGEKVEAGEYSLFTIPGESKWTVMLNSEADLRGTGGYDAGKDVVRIEVEPMEFPLEVETMTFVFGNVKDTSADLNLIWANTAIAIPISVEKTW